jgi:hypothetical protein
MALLAREIGIGPLSSSPSFGRRVRACLLVARVAGLTWIWPSSVWAGRISVWLEVGRAPESRQCPDAATVLATAKALFPGIALDSAPRPEQASLVAVISIRRGPEGQVALLTLRGTHGGQRRIVGRDDSCRGLSHALAVALLLLIEPTATPLEPSPPGRPSASPALRPLSPARRFRGGMALQTGGLGSVGLLGRPAWGGFLGLELWHEPGIAPLAATNTPRTDPEQASSQVGLGPALADPPTPALAASTLPREENERPRLTTPRGAAPRESAANPSATRAAESVAPIPAAALPALADTVPGFQADRIAERPRPNLLEEEALELARANHLLETGRAAEAQALLTQSSLRFGAGALAHEREALTIKVLLLSGQRELARRRAESFLLQYPKSPLAERVRALIDG